MKEVLETTAAIAGLLTAIIPVLARVIDWRMRAARMTRRAGRLHQLDRMPLGVMKPPLPSAAKARRMSVAEPVVLELADEAEWEDEPIADVPRVERARSLVKAPAIVLLVAGALGLCFNLFFAGFGFIDEFVTPLSPQSKAVSPTESKKEQRKDEIDERSNAAIGFVTLLSLSVPCAMAIWAGVNMIRLRSYWLSVAGSIAIMPGACFCCLAGFPIGIWSLVILFRPEVSSTFT
ncbi:MAG TPA: hypothetical protein VMG10_31085 [Gemmataceae bacterium]|nr:hypothetical protein [Gemmataceae bacterium]